MKTREKILRKALELFNERGVYGVGVREIARALEISPGNLQYHFAQKDLLVTELMRRLHAANNERTSGVAAGEVCFDAVHRLTCESLLGHIPYRGLFLSYASVVASNPSLAEFVRDQRDARRARMGQIVPPLVRAGYLDPDRISGRTAQLWRQFEAMGQFWLAAAVVAGDGDDLPAAAVRRAELMLLLWEPYATERGRAQICRILDATPSRA